MNLTVVLNTYLASKDSVKPIEDKLEIRQEQGHTAPIWALYLDGSKKDNDKDIERIKASVETIKKCINDKRIGSKLAGLRCRHCELEANMSREK